MGDGTCVHGACVSCSRHPEICCKPQIFTAQKRSPPTHDDNQQMNNTSVFNIIQNNKFHQVLSDISSLGPTLL